MELVTRLPAATCCSSAPACTVGVLAFVDPRTILERRPPVPAEATPFGPPPY